jgi:hypothetical protein
VDEKKGASPLGSGVSSNDKGRCMQKIITIGDIHRGNRETTCIVTEIGITQNGTTGLAKEMVNKQRDRLY